MAGGGSVVIQRQGDAMPSGIDVNRMPKPIMEVGAWQKKHVPSEKETGRRQLCSSNLPLLPTCDRKYAAEL